MIPPQHLHLPDADAEVESSGLAMVAFLVDVMRAKKSFAGVAAVT